METRASPDKNSALIISGVSWTPEPSHLNTDKRTESEHESSNLTRKKIPTKRSIDVNVACAYGLSISGARSSGGPVRGGGGGGSISVL